MKKEVLTEEQVELEIERLSHSKYVLLAKKEERIKNKRRQYLYSLRSKEKRGKELVEEGYTLKNIEERLFKE